MESPIDTKHGIDVTLLEIFINVNDDFIWQIKKSHRCVLIVSSPNVRSSISSSLIKLNSSFVLG